MLELQFFFYEVRHCSHAICASEKHGHAIYAENVGAVYIALRGSCVIRPELNPFFHSMNNDVQVQLLIAI